MKNRGPALGIALIAVLFSGCNKHLATKVEEKPPRIANIINFVRNTEPRDPAITDEVLYNTVVEQIKQVKKYSLPATFLLQYDALINPKYQSLLKDVLPADCEVGGWWEITQPHVEAAGMVWRGAYPWDWHANVGFATGYTPVEREKLVDVYMEKFKSIFGKYPSSIGSWFIDSHSLQYMYDKYKIVASCNCKDQIGTDGYTMWGGYWNQGYYPSKNNAYIPAQTEENQIPVPIFRMLGSDPIYQYYAGLGGSVQHVESLEPVYGNGGGNENWVNWFFDIVVKKETLSFQYMQIGQENSFTWDRMKHGLEIQIPKLDSLRKLGLVRVETLEQTGRWFKEQYKVTPASAVCALDDIRNQGEKSVWYNSRFYRTNLYWHQDQFLIRDIHLFDEDLKSDYLTQAGTSTQCEYKALPFVDGFTWSSLDHLAGLRIMMKDEQGNSIELKSDTPTVKSIPPGTLSVQFKLIPTGYCSIKCEESKLVLSCEGLAGINWWLEFSVAPEASLPFSKIDAASIQAIFKGFKYQVGCEAGTIEGNQDKSFQPFVYRIHPKVNSIILNLDNK